MTLLKVEVDELSPLTKMFRGLDKEEEVFDEVSDDEFMNMDAETMFKQYADKDTKKGKGDTVMVSEVNDLVHGLSVNGLTKLQKILQNHEDVDIEVNGIEDMYNAIEQLPQKALQRLHRMLK